MIPIVPINFGEEPMPYTGLGTVKYVKSKPNDAMMKVILQIDIVNPLDKRNRW